VNPSIYQLNPRLYLSTLGRSATLDDIPEQFLAELSKQGFDWLWLLGVWTLGPGSVAVAREHPGCRQEFLSVLPDLTHSDITGSPFAVCAYNVDPAFGGDEALSRFRKRLAEFGMRLLLDFVPNHVGLDHPWLSTHPEFLIQGTDQDLQNDPSTWGRVADGRVFAFGRDPHFHGWSDTLQLNYFNPALRLAMFSQLHKIATVCDGVRCDMAMLIEPEVFRRTWGERAPHCVQGFSSFWPETIASVRTIHPEFLFIAEVYWDYEHILQRHGFDYTYDKVLYDRLLSLDGRHARGHLTAPLDYQKRMLHFLENHDEPRIASKLSLREHRAAALVTFFAPGMRLIHDGQLTGKRIRVPVQLARGPIERPSSAVQDLYRELLPLLQSPAVKHGSWHLLDNHPAWPGNASHESFICYVREHPLKTLLIAVNYSQHRGQCFVRIPDRAWLEGSIEFRDLLSHERLVRTASDLVERGLFLDCDAFQCHIFSVEHH
jgi:glycosidase